MRRLKDDLRWRGEEICCGLGGETGVRILLGLVESKPREEMPSEAQQEIGCARISSGEKQRYLLPCPVLIEQAFELCFGESLAHDRRSVETGGNKHKRFERMPNQYEIEIINPLRGKCTGEVENLKVSVEAWWVGVGARFWVVADVGNDFGVLVFQWNHAVIVKQALPCVVTKTEGLDDVGVLYNHT